MISGNYLASGNEQYLTIGNFNSSVNTTLSSISGQTNVNSYYYIDDVSVIKNSSIINIELGNDTTLCPGESLTLDATTTNATYLWQDNSTNSTFNVTQPGTYWVQVTNSLGSSTDTINVSYYPIQTLELGNDTTLCLGESLILDATTTNATYLWQDNSTNSTFNVTQPGTYWVEVAVNNCVATDTILVVEDDCEIILKIPNVFTPNNDGVNDLFTPTISKGIVSMQTIIYNRWGNKIYKTDNLLIEWSGQNVSDGTYFWIIYYTDITGSENNINGYLTIFR